MDNNDDDDLPSPARDEGTRVRLEHDLYLKAVNNPVRRRILELLSNASLSIDDLGSKLVSESLIRDAKDVSYHLDFLIKARCIAIKENEVSITQGGRVVDYFK